MNVDEVRTGQFHLSVWLQGRGSIPQPQKYSYFYLSLALVSLYLQLNERDRVQCEIKIRLISIVITFEIVVIFAKNSTVSLSWTIHLLSIHYISVISEIDSILVIQYQFLVQSSKPFEDANVNEYCAQSLIKVL